MTEQEQLESHWAKRVVEHLKSGKKFIVQMLNPVQIGSVIDALENDAGEVWHQRFVIVRECTRAEFVEHMKDISILPMPADVGRYWELMAD